MRGPQAENIGSAPTLFRRLVLLPVLFLGAYCAILVSAHGAIAAGYEQVATFGGVLQAPTPPGNFPENAQLGGATAIAVNRTGAGGVAAGTVYAVALPVGGGQARVSRYSPQGAFELEWNGSARCGPALGTTCPSHAEGSETAAVDVEIDQTTGNVYVFRAEGLPAGQDGITEWNADGSQMIAQFGEIAATGELIAVSPAKLHGTFGLPGALAVTPSGTVYVYDAEQGGDFRYRLMIFEPEAPEDFAHYKYAGESSGAPHGEISAGHEVHEPSRPVLSDAGHVFVGGESFVEEYNPTAPTPTPLCTFSIKDKGARGMTINPETGDVFFFDYKDRKIHELRGACGPDGHFVEIQSVPVSPKRASPQGLAVNPELEWEPGRHGGTLYIVAPAAVDEELVGEPGAGALGYIFAQAVSHPPIVVSESVANVGVDTAILRGAIKPEGLVTRFSFEYLTEAAYQANAPLDRFAGATVIPVGGASVEGLVGTVPVSTAIAGLAADTVYRFRVVASNEAGSAPGEDGSFHTYPASTGLPDARGYELVSPAEKDGGEVWPALPSIGSCLGVCKPGYLLENFPAQSSPDGASVVYEGSAFGFGTGALQENEYVSRRTSEGWQTVFLSPEQQSPSSEMGFRAFDPSLSIGIINQLLPALSPTAPPGYPNLYRQTTSSPGALSPILSAAPPNRPAGVSLKLSFAGSSEDLSRVFFTANDALTKKTAFAPAAKNGGAGKANLYEWHEGTLSLVNVLPGNATAPAGASLGGAGLTGAISKDGAYAFWSAESGQVFVREAGERTKEISTAGIPDPGAFLAAATDGSKVLLANGHLHELTGAENSTDLTKGEGDFEGIVGKSDDLTHIYFVDSAVLTGKEENGNHESAEVGSHNLYSWQQGTTVFIGRLAANDSEDWRASPAALRTAQASADGRWLAFESRASLSEYDNVGPCQRNVDGFLPAPCSEVYLYDGIGNRLRCVSCNPSGEPPIGESRIPSREALKATTLPQMAYLTDAGRLYFDSGDRLAAADVNGRHEDVYQYEPGGVGGCARFDGCLDLISSGRSPSDSNLLAADESGENVFFTTRGQLVPADEDGLVDLYDARVGGSTQTEAQPAECAGEGCQGSPAPLPVQTAPSSSSIPPEPPAKTKCKKGQVKRGGRCVKKPKKKQHQHHTKNKNHAAKSRRGGK